LSFNNEVNKKEYNGYTYLDENINEVDSTIKSSLEKWYEENIKDTEFETEIVDSIYCNDKSKKENETDAIEVEDNITDTEENIGIEEKISNIIYNPYTRLNQEPKPSLVCNPADSYTVSTEIGNGSLKYPIGLITADELYLTGSKYFDHNISFWTMTSAKYEESIAYNFSYNNKLDITSVNEKLGLKPVITIKSTNITGIGSKEQPFQITN